MEDKLKYPDEVMNLHFNEKHQQNVLNSLKGITEDPYRKKSKFKKIAYSGIAAAVLFTIFIVSARFSPVMAKVVAQIPYFSQFIKQEEFKFAIYHVISDVANKKGFELNQSQVDLPKKKITITVFGSKSEVNRIKSRIAKDMNKELKAQNFGEFKITVKREKLTKVVVDDSPKVKQYMKDSEELQNKIITMLNENHYIMAFPPQVQINEIQKSIYVAVPKTESNQRMKDIKNMLIATSKEYGEFKFRISKIDMKAREQEIRWGKNGIINIIAQGLMENKKFKVTGFSYSFHPLPLQITVKTSLKATNPEAKETANKIETEIKTFIQTDELTKEIRNDPYELTVLSKDKKKIN
jgi:hypothetical protein